MAGFDRLAGAIQAQGDSTDTRKRRRPILEPDDLDKRQRRAQIDTLYTLNNRRDDDSTAFDRNRDDVSARKRLTSSVGPLGMSEWLSMLLRKPNTERR